MSQARTHVVVLGGGYAGTMAANRLRRRKDLQITLVTTYPHFVHRIRLHEFAASGTEVTADYKKLLGKDIDLVVDTVSRIDVGARALHLGSGTSLAYDYLVYAAGSTGLSTAPIPGALEFAHQIGDLDQAAHLREVLGQLPPQAPVTVIGGGPTGIETAGELAEQGHATTLVTARRLVPTCTPRARRALREQLSALSVRIVEDTAVTQVWPEALELTDGTRLPSGLTVWAGGFNVPDLARTSGLRTDELGRLLTDETLTSVDDERVVAAGDAAAPSGQPLPMACQSALPLGAMAAETVLTRIAGRQPAGIDLGFIGMAISVGRRAATIQTLHRDATARSRVLAGYPAVSLKKVGVRFPLLGLRAEARRPGTALWPKGGRKLITAPVP